MSVIQELEPKAVWSHFEEIRQIPRPSAKEQRAREWVLAKAKKKGLEVIEDKVGNIVVRKPAHPGREKAPVVALQGHLDMVCEKNESVAHDFDKDPIEVVRKGEWLYANGTTLGADNGVGVSAALGVMESDDIKHGPLEFVFTIDEERGLTGASEFPGGVLHARYFLNLDGEEKGTLCIGCSGGVNTTARRKVGLRPAAADTAYKVKVSGLKGGHSGVDIHLGRGNALRVLGGVVQRLIEQVNVEVADLKGGSARNVIPREATAVIVADHGREVELKAAVAAFAAETKTDFGEFDPGVQISVEKTERPAQVIDPKDARTVVDLLVAIPHGVLAMSPDVPGLVQNSTNLATVSVKNGEVEIGSSQRSAIESSKQAAAKMVATSCGLAGFEVEHAGSYPGWKPEPHSEIVQKCKEAFQEVFGSETRLVAMHAGLECGVIGEKYPGMQLISFGPQIESPHSPNERVEIPSVGEFWKYLKAVLEKL
ncbi:MAG: aminoacyl-histidine dipeptidase [Terriglobales bacterium]